MDEKEIKLLERARIPKLFWDCSFDKIPEGLHHKEFVQSFAQSIEKHLSDGIGLFLWGTYSCGKTAISTLLIRQAISVKKLALFISSCEIPELIIEKKDFDSEESFLDRIRRVDLLVIDDVVDHGKDTFRDHVIESIVRERLYDKKSVIITSNLSPLALISKYPALIVMKEGLIPVDCTGFDFREDKSKLLQQRVENVCSRK